MGYSPEEKYRAFLGMATAITSKRDPDGVFHSAVQSFRRLVQFDYAAVLIPNAENDTFRLQLLEIDEPNPVFTQYVEVPKKGSLVGWVMEQRQSLLVPDFDKEQRFPASTSRLLAGGLRSGCLVP